METKTKKKNFEIVSQGPCRMRHGKINIVCIDDNDKYEVCTKSKVKKRNLKYWGHKLIRSVLQKCLQLQVVVELGSV